MYSNLAATDLRSDTSLKFGSYGIHIDAQRDALVKIAEAKAYAKAVKADDATVPTHLWNERVIAPGIASSVRDQEIWQNHPGPCK